jgi:hypothetical protein
MRERCSLCPRTFRDGLVIFGLATEALPDRWGVRRGRRLWPRFLFLLRAGEALPDRWGDWSRGLWHRFLFSCRLHPFLRARRRTAFCLLGFLRHVQLNPLAPDTLTRRRASKQRKISTRVWPFGKNLWLLVLGLPNGIGTPNFLGAPEIAVRLGHQFAFLAGQGSYKLCGTSICNIRQPRIPRSLCQVCDANGLVALLGGFAMEGATPV